VDRERVDEDAMILQLPPLPGSKAVTKRRFRVMKPLAASGPANGAAAILFR
jgi:hypothetical protein